MPAPTRITLVPGKTYVYTGTEGDYSVIAGQVLEGGVFPQGAKGDTGNTGPVGAKGDTGSAGAGLKKHSASLSAETYLSSQTTATDFTTASSSSFPAVLLLNGEMESGGGIITPASHTWTRKSGVTATGSKFTIVTAGRYKIDYTITLSVDVSTASASSVTVTASIDYSTDGGDITKELASQAVTVASTSTATAQTTIELTKTIFLPAGTIIFFKAKRSASTVATKVFVNAIDQTEVGDDTFVVITKL